MNTRPTIPAIEDALANAGGRPEMPDSLAYKLAHPAEIRNFGPISERCDDCADGYPSPLCPHYEHDGLCNHPERELPAEGKSPPEHHGDKIVRLATELLAELRFLASYGYMAADDASHAEDILGALEESFSADEYDAQPVVAAIRMWLTQRLSRWECEWDETGRYECASGGQNPPRYFRE